MTRTLVFFIITAALAITVSSHSIWSPDVCLFDIECPTNFFCNDTSIMIYNAYSQITQCDRRLPENAVCSKNGLKECEIGFSCSNEDVSRSSKPRCLRRGSRGEKCRTYDSFSCKPPLRCSTKNSTCQPLTTGFAGTPCQFDGECQLEKGLYCDHSSGVCKPKFGPGDKCNVRKDSDRCLGFCAGQGFEDGVCLSLRKEGQVCTEDTQCENPITRTPVLEPNADPLVCNIPKGSTGRCVRRSHLLTLPGAKCDPDLDLCSRSLSCLPKGRGGYVCQHRGSKFSSCDPQSSLSRCLWEDVKLECRLFRIKPTEFIPDTIPPFFECNRRSEKVARGDVCMAEYAFCERGTECRKVPDVLARNLLVKFPPPQVAFCVRMVPEGASCGEEKDKFTTQCGNGLQCERGTCVNQNSNTRFDRPLTHAGLRAPCADLPCVPGLVCESEEPGSEKLCILPLKIVGKGFPCVDRAVERRRCADGLVCAFKKNGKNVKRCRVPRKAGDYCEADNECAKGLLCAPAWTPSRESTERRCYDPRKKLSLGQACNPEASGSQPQCVANERPNFDVPTETTFDPMRCAAKGNGFACRVIRQLFEPCDKAKDIICDSGLHCGRYGVCVPVGET